MKFCQLLIGSELTNVLRRYGQVDQRRLRTVINICFRLYEMAREFKKFAKKISRCAKRYPDKANEIVWASFMYKISYFKVVQLGLEYRYYDVRKVVVAPVPLVPFERIDIPESKPIRKEGFSEVRRFKNNLLKKGMHYFQGNWNYIENGELCTQPKMDYGMKGARKMNFVHLSYLRAFEFKYFEETLCTYEDAPGGGRIFASSRMEIYSFEHRHSSDDEFNLKFGGCDDIYGAEYGHFIALNVKFSVFFDKNYRGYSEIWVERDHLGPVYESLYTAMSTKYSKRTVVYYKQLKNEDSSKFVFNLPLVGDLNSGDGMYVLCVRTVGRVHVHRSVHILKTVECCGLQSYNFRCSCRHSKMGMPDCRFERAQRCIPYKIGNCEFCLHRQDFRLISMMGDREVTKNFDKVFDQVHNDYALKPIDCSRQYLINLEMLDDFFDFLDDKYDCTVLRGYNKELCIASYNLFALEECDFVSFSGVYESCIFPYTNYHLVMSAPSDLELKRCVRYPYNSSILLTNWNIFDLEEENKDEVELIKDNKSGSGVWWN